MSKFIPETVKCPPCDGKGWRYERKAFGNYEVLPSFYMGLPVQGQVTANECSNCGGSGQIQMKKLEKAQ